MYCHGKNPLDRKEDLIVNLEDEEFDSSFDNLDVEKEELNFEKEATRRVYDFEMRKENNKTLSSINVLYNQGNKYNMNDFQNSMKWHRVDAPNNNPKINSISKNTYSNCKMTKMIDLCGDNSFDNGDKTTTLLGKKTERPYSKNLDSKLKEKFKYLRSEVSNLKCIIKRNGKNLLDVSTNFNGNADNNFNPKMNILIDEKHEGLKTSQDQEANRFNANSVNFTESKESELVKELSEKVQNLEHKVNHFTHSKNEAHKSNDHKLLIKLFGAAMKLIIQLDDTVTSKLEYKCESCSNFEKRESILKPGKEENKIELTNEVLYNADSTIISLFNNNIDDKAFQNTGNWSDILYQDNNLQNENAKNMRNFNYSSLNNYENKNKNSTTFKKFKSGGISHSPRCLSLAKKNKSDSQNNIINLINSDKVNFLCFKCGQPNHIAKKCSKNI